ncbi:hypothetical protein AD928_01920, partial [Acetobacter cerevisiae]
MIFEQLNIDILRVNRANDRHGEVGSEDLAIAELFRLHESRMRNLAADIAAVGTVFDPPLVRPFEGVYVVFDGNRRITCLKLLLDPKRAPSPELRLYFEELANKAEIPEALTCQIEENQKVINQILFRRHTGSQGGVGQIDWNDRAKLNFSERTGQSSKINVGAEVEHLLGNAKKLPDGNIPWSTMSRLLSSEEFRNRVGISATGRKFKLIHDHEAVTKALSRCLVPG